MDFSSLPPSVTNLPLQIQSGDSRPAPKSTRQNRHSFWLGLRQRSSSRLNSTTTLATYPNQQPSRSMTIDSITKSPSLLGPSRVIAVVGNIRRGIGRMILEELVLKRCIVVALIDKPDGNFSRSVEALACSPSLFHAFAIEGGLFGREMIEDRSSPANSFQNFPPINPLQASTQSGTKNQRSNFKLTQMKRSKKFNSMIAISKTVDDSRNHPSTGQSLLGITGDNSRKKIKDELSRIFEAYRVDTVICSFEPQSKSANEAGFRTQERAKDEVQFGLDSVSERKRIESMERAVLESCIQSGVVGRLALTVHSTGPSPSPLTPPPTSSIRPHLMIGNDQSNPRISVTEFRWGFLMNELASEGCLIDGATAENGLGKYLLEPGKGPDGRWVIDFEHKRARLPTCRSISELGKGKQKPETVCFTLAEDVARFVSLACKLREPWDWNTGKMVGDTARGGWDEVVDLIERVSRSKLEREYFQVIPTVSSGGNESSSETSSSKSSTDQQSSTLPVSSEEGTLRESFDKYDDRLRAKLAEEGLDASSVRLSEFVRVWFTPLPQPPTIKIDGSRVRKPQGSAVKHTKKSDQHLAVAQPAAQLG
ncbi:hypothetical protein PPACK8108_LOCUS977 [Phakopsora pachyrhizi]|uniref:Uncharacterized protein n=1 Tax=Phakopsora pachyrhizi TaxID=170000 RepID=A0AAV0AGK0_PHAPC|nr:hypothetical protein PPACK8108_LOCUS977 [Phakopsora pachyrhizi]